MGVYKAKSGKTKDGRVCFFRVRYQNVDGRNTQYKSGKFATRKEAEDAELEFRLKIHRHKNMDKITLDEMIDIFIENRTSTIEVKNTPLYNYGNKRIHLKSLLNIKLKDFNINHYDNWKKQMNETNISTRYKNDILKFLKSVLNFAMTWYDYNLNKVYNKMTKFSNASDIPKEMMDFTYDQWKQFISVETNLQSKVMFEILYYCGLRKGELRGLTWRNVDLVNKTLSVKKQITDCSDSVKEFQFSIPKTKSSIKETLPLNKVLLNDIKMLKNEVSREYGFNDDYFVIDDAFPVASNTITSRKNRNCKLANVPQIRIHDFRHSCASLLVNNGANITVVAKYLGHTKIEETLNTYTHLFNSTLNEVVSIIDSLEDNI